MSDEFLKDYLKKNVKEVPAAPLGEGAMIWNKIAQQSEKTKMGWLWWSLAPLLAASVALVISLQQKKEISVSEEDLLYQEWTEFVKDIDAETELDAVVIYEK